MGIRNTALGGGWLLAAALVGSCAVIPAPSARNASPVADPPAGYHSAFAIRSNRQPAPEADPPDGWSTGSEVTEEGIAKARAMLGPREPGSLAADYGDRMDRLVFLFLVKDASGRWTTASSGNVADPNVERMWIDPKSRTVGMVIDTAVRCPEIDPASRPKIGYNGCTSNFIAPVTDGRNVWPTVDRRAFVEAAKQAGAFEHANSAVLAFRRENEQRAERERQARADAAIERQVEAARALQDSQQLRSRLSVGDATHCGMVIEIRRPIAKVQTIEGEKWFRVEQLFAPGAAPCRFYNDVYQDP